MFTGADVEALTLEGRAQAEALMVDTCRIERPGKPVTDPVTGVVTPSMTVVYAGRCKVQSGSAANLASTPQAGGRYLVIEGQMLHLPVASQCQINDVATITECVMDPDLVGLRFRLTEYPRATFRTADRWSTELVTK